MPLARRRLAGVRGDQKQLDAVVAETRSKIDAVKPKVEAETRRERQRRWRSVR